MPEPSLLSKIFSMAGGAPKNLVTLAAAVLVAASLASCGSDEPAATGARPSEGTTAEETVADTSTPVRSGVKTGPLRVTGGGVGRFRDIGDYTTLEFGQEANRRALEEAARVVHEFLVARVRYDWATSCSLLDDHASKEVPIVGAHFKEVAGKDCPTIIAYLLGKVPARKTFVASEVDAGVLRVRREGAHFFYRAGGDPYTINLTRDEDGNWKLDSFLITKISPPPS